MYCRKCGREIPSNALFCTCCGADTADSDNIPQPETKYEYRRKDAKTRRLVKMVLTLVYVAMIIIGISEYNRSNKPVENRVMIPSVSSQYSNCDEAAIEFVKEGYFQNFSQTVTVGQAFNSYFIDPQWKTVLLGKSKYVLFNGLAAKASNNSLVRVEFRFLINGDQFEITSWSMEGTVQPMSLLPSILNSVYKGWNN